MADAAALARELTDAFASARQFPPPSSRNTAFDLSDAYSVEAELVRLRRAAGHVAVGRKVGYANKAVWRVLKLDTLVWAHMYDDTVRFAQGGEASLSIGRMSSPKIEPEIVFRLAKPVDAGTADPAIVLGTVEWLALGFEIIDCVFPEWKFTPADFVAAFGLHAALVVGEPRPMRPETIPELAGQLASFKVKLSKNGELVEEGAGRNALRSPALCLAELASAIARQPLADPLASGELVSTGTLTESQPIRAGETWKATVEGIDLGEVTVRLEV
jgi:2-keto-4-pentenoate hydratase